MKEIVKKLKKKSWILSLIGIEGLIFLVVSIAVLIKFRGIILDKLMNLF